MSVTIHRNEEGLVTLTFTPHVYVATHHTTNVILSSAEWEQLKQVVDAEEAWETGDHSAACPICGTPVSPGEPCLPCLRSLRAEATT